MSHINTEIGQELCTGCSACEAVCPTNAIQCKINEYGYLTPEVDNHTCIDCGRCKSVCMKYQGGQEIKSIWNAKLYAGQSISDQTIMECSSGGIAYEIAKWGIEKGYYVVGTIYDYQNEMAKMYIASSNEELELFKGSKYIQSIPGTVWNDVMKGINEKGIKYIVFGMPCQIYGLTKTLEKHKIDLENVILVDFLCHGVPSYNIWKSYLEYLKCKKGIGQVQKITFRSKKYGWHNFLISIIGTNGDYEELSYNDLFYKVFFDKSFLNKACEKCCVRKEMSSADIRLGDFWGKRYIHDNRGVSAILSNTKKGNDLIRKLENEKRIRIMEENINIEECMKYQCTFDYDSIEEDTQKLKEVNLPKLVRQYRRKLNKKKKVMLFVKDMLKILPLKYRLKLIQLVRR